MVIMPVIPALGRLRQGEFKANLDKILSQKNKIRQQPKTKKKKRHKKKLIYFTMPQFRQKTEELSLS
jgi:hypothetical protein